MDAVPIHGSFPLDEIEEVWSDDGAEVCVRRMIYSWMTFASLLKIVHKFSHERYIHRPPIADHQFRLAGMWMARHLLA